MQELRLQPYHDLRGAIFRPEAGWSIPAGYGSLDAEVRAVRTRVGMIDLSDRAKIELTGSERVPFLDGLVTTDLKIFGPGMSTYALLLNEKSRVLGDLRVYAFADSLVLDIDPAQKDSILRLLEKARVSDDVEFRDLGLCGHIEVHGPSSGEAVSAVVGNDVRGLSDNAFLTFSVDRHHEGRAVRLRTFGEEGYAIWSAGASLAEEWESLVRRDVTPIGRDAASTSGWRAVWQMPITAMRARSACGTRARAAIAASRRAAASGSLMSWPTSPRCSASWSGCWK